MEFQVPTLPQEVVRRSMHISESLPFKERVEILESFSRMMTFSGYSRQQVRHNMISGLTTYEKKRLAAGDSSICRSKETLDNNREVRQVLEKDQWFLDREQLEQDDKITTNSHLYSTRGKGRGIKGTHLTQARRRFQPVAVLFVPRCE